MHGTFDPQVPEAKLNFILKYGHPNSINKRKENLDDLDSVVLNMLGPAQKLCLHNDTPIVVKNPNLQHSHVIYTMMSKVCFFNNTL